MLTWVVPSGAWLVVPCGANVGGACCAWLVACARGGMYLSFSRRTASDTVRLVELFSKFSPTRRIILRIYVFSLFFLRCGLTFPLV